MRTRIFTCNQALVTQKTHTVEQAKVELHIHCKVVTSVPSSFVLYNMRWDFHLKLVRGGYRKPTVVAEVRASVFMYLGQTPDLGFES